jgi:MFS family permease
MAGYGAGLMTNGNENIGRRHFEPTMARYGVVTATTAIAALFAVYQYCIGVAAKPIMDEFGVTYEEMGLAASAFFLAYAVGQLPAGWLADHYGARLALSVSVIVSAIFIGVSSLVAGAFGLILSRLMLGLSQAGSFPITARIFSSWIPFQRRGLASSILGFGARAGVVLAPWLTGWLMVHGYGWRRVFGLYTLVGLNIGILFWIWFRNTPTEHASHADVEPGNSTHLDAGQIPVPGRPPWISMMTSAGLWLQCLSQFILNVAWTFLPIWLPTYLMVTYSVGLEQVALLVTVPSLAGMVGCLLGGVATDHLSRRLGVKWGRQLMGIVSQCIAALGIIGALYAEDLHTAIAACSLCWFGSDLTVGATLSYFQDTGGRYVGTFLGWANMFGNLGAAVSPVLLGYVVDNHGWPLALCLCACLFAGAGILWFGIDARTPILRPHLADSLEKSGADMASGHQEETTIGEMLRS